ncbi:MAG: DUF4174 domain-containing protein [Pseudomonadota bacterium]
MLNRRRMVAGLAALGAGLAKPALAFPQYRWQNRVLVLQVRNLNQLVLSQQKTALRADRDGLAIRDMAVFAMTADAVAPVFGPAPDLAETSVVGRLPEGMDFRATLIGKDGGVKARWDEPVSLNELYAVIDVMPMRRREMRERGG